MNKKIRQYVAALACLLGLLAPLPAAVGQTDDVVSNAFVRDQIRSIIDQVKAYRGALQALTQEAKFVVQAKAAETKIEALLRRVDKLTTDNRLQEALSVAEEANRLIVDAIVRMRSGETVVVSLSFDSPAQEFAYEKRRFESSEVMIGMAIEDGRNVATNARGNVDRLLAEARQQRDLGEREAAAGRYAAAVRTLEEANRRLTRALQELGVPVF